MQERISTHKEESVKLIRKKVEIVKSSCVENIGKNIVNISTLAER